MEPDAYAEDFLANVKSDEGPELISLFRARAVVRPDPPRLFSLIPLGWTAIWPDCITFVSDTSSGTHDPGGMPHYTRRMHSHLRNTEPGLSDRIIGRIPEHLVYLGHRIGRGLEDPEPISIPLNKLAGVQRGHRVTQGDWIRLEVDGSYVFLCEPLGATGVLDLITSPLIDWQDGLVRQLVARVSENRRNGRLIEQPHVSAPH